MGSEQVAEDGAGDEEHENSDTEAGNDDDPPNKADTDREPEQDKPPAPGGEPGKTPKVKTPVQEAETSAKLQMGRYNGAMTSARTILTSVNVDADWEWAKEAAAKPLQTAYDKAAAYVEREKAVSKALAAGLPDLKKDRWNLSTTSTWRGRGVPSCPPGERFGSWGHHGSTRRVLVWNAPAR